MKLVRTITVGLLVLVGCASNKQPTSSPPRTTSSTIARPGTGPGSTPEERNAARGRAHRLVVDATGCWFGAIWKDALGEDGRSRCEDVLESAYGHVDTDRLLRLRGFDAIEVGELRSHIVYVAKNDPRDAGRAASLIRMFDAIASAQRETMLARRAGDRIKKDIDGVRVNGDRHSDERASVAQLSTFDAVRALYSLDVGELSPEARATAILCAMDRMNTANGLPKHIKVYAVQGAFSMLFGVAPPEVPSDPTKPMKAGRWLAYLSDVARAAGHPVPPEAVTLQGKQVMAWAGVLEGFADKLRSEQPNISSETDMDRAVKGAARRLDTEYREALAAVTAGSQRVKP
jgi:hypothetical protein